MKRLVYILIIGVLMLNSGCKKFLEEQSLDEVKPGTVQDLTSLMSADGYPYASSKNNNNRLNLVVDMISDDVESFGGQGQASYVQVARAGKAPYTWSKEMFELSNQAGINSWGIIYQRIAGCNVVLSHLDKVSGSLAEKENLKGQALAMRGYYYFMLVNLFAKPYNDPSIDPAISLGVPLKLRMEVTGEYMSRNTVAEVYSQIEADLKQAADILKNYPQASESSVYKMNETAVYALLSRMYLYQEKWDLVVEYTAKGLAKKSILSQLSSFVAAGGYYLFNNAFTSQPGQNRIYDVSRSKEILWTYLPKDNGLGDWFRTSILPSYSATLKPVYAPSTELMALYDTRPMTDNAIYLADLRPRLYFLYAAYFTPTWTVGYANVNGGMGGSGIRVAELYLNRAEANIHKFIETGDINSRTGALNDINLLRSSRYDPRMPYQNIEITDGNELLDFYKDERRREFPFEEGHRWFDLRRYGMPSITHIYEEMPGLGETFVLEERDSRYTLPIPLEVIKRNGALIQNP